MRVKIKNLNRWFRNKPIFYKITFSTFIIVAVPTLLMMVILTSLNERTTQERLGATALANLNYAELQVENLFESCQILGRNIASNDVVQKMLIRGGTLSVFDNRELSSAIDNTIKTSSIVHSAILYSLSGDIYASSGIHTNNTVINLPAFSSSAELMRKEWPLIRSSYQPNNYLFPVGDSEYLQFISPIFDASTANALGFCEINVHENVLHTILAPYQDQNTSFLLYDRDGILLNQKTHKSLSSKAIRDLNSIDIPLNHIITLDNERYAVYKNRLYGFDSTLFILISMSSKNTALTVYLIILMLSLLILLFFTSYTISKSITNNLVMLTQHVDRIKEGDLNSVIPIQSNDEVGKLSEDFNQMTLRIKGLINEVKEVNVAKRKSDLVALQSQINPHFLYNTLESVSALIMLKRYDDALLLSNSLSRYYQIVLSNGVTMISLREELKNVEHYLIIQKMRYDSKIQYEIKTHEDLMDYKILKLTVQPLVENAIYHGLRNKQGASRLIVSCMQENQILVITVFDDGIGIEETDITKLFKPDSTEYKNRGFGLRSIDERIKLQYGPDYGLEMRSEPGEWTEFSIHIPLTTQNDGRTAW